MVGGELTVILPSTTVPGHLDMVDEDSDLEQYTQSDCRTRNQDN